MLEQFICYEYDSKINKIKLNGAGYGRSNGG